MSSFFYPQTSKGKIFKEIYTKHFLKIIFHYVFVCVCVGVDVHQCRFPKRPEWDNWIPWAGVIDKLITMGAGNWTQVLCKSSRHLTNILCFLYHKYTHTFAHPMFRGLMWIPPMHSFIILESVLAYLILSENVEVLVVKLLFYILRF